MISEFVVGVGVTTTAAAAVVVVGSGVIVGIGALYLGCCSSTVLFFVVTRLWCCDGLIEPR